MKRALVTGGCGFVGSHLAKKLVSEGWLVDIVDDMSNGHLKFLESKENVELQLQKHVTDIQNKQVTITSDTGRTKHFKCKTVIFSSLNN